jgi:mono/diheme cytochrome c family protein
MRNSRVRSQYPLLLLIVFGCLASPAEGEDAAVFRDQISQILGQRCVQCHGANVREAGLSLATAEGMFSGGDSGPAVVAGDADGSLLVEMISGEEPEMPKDAVALSADEVAVIRQWIAEGAHWPDDWVVEEPAVTDVDWWSLRPVDRPTIPAVAAADRPWMRTPIDAFVFAELRRNGLSPSPEADRRTLIRRLYFDLTGLPPSYDEVEVFVNDTDPRAYDRLVDRLLSSPHYGERWARHWLDVVHYGDTHGYDKDKLRPNAWPYRDYVIRSFNVDKPYARFVQEQVAGDVLWPGTRDGIEATGFIAAGPWDFIGHAEVPESKHDGKVARNLDRDDMVSSTINTFLSFTVQCARCHNHKFDPITQEHYYSLQAVFAALDRADRTYDIGSPLAIRRGELNDQQARLQELQKQLAAEVQRQGGDGLAALDARIVAQRESAIQETAEYGFHSEISLQQDVTKWVQIDLGQTTRVESVVLVGAKDDFNGIGAGFGFPLRFRVELSGTADLSDAVVVVADQTQEDFENPGVTPVTLPIEGQVGRYLRVTATKLAERQDDFIFALAELMALSSEGNNVAARASVEARDSIEAPVRWSRTNLVDGRYVGSGAGLDGEEQLASLTAERKAWIEQHVSDSIRTQVDDVERRLQEVVSRLNALPAPNRVYAGTVHHGSGAFVGTGAAGGRPREIHVLLRGEVANPGPIVGPGTLPVIPEIGWQFQLPENHSEGDRRAALAAWLVRDDNPLVWRSLVNRLWLYHFGRGIVDSPNDFGRMGQLPSHPDLLDWMAAEFRDGGQSIKQLHRMIVTSHVYRQSSADNPAYAKLDAENQWLWRMNRRLLSAEAIRDSVLMVSGKLDPHMYGPAFQDFVIERPEHSPHFQYHMYDPDDVTTHRRSIYRFLVRSQQQPFMQSLGCADPSQSVAKRDPALTSIQALTLLNNRFMVRMSEHFASRLEQASCESTERIQQAFHIALSRSPTAAEAAALGDFVDQFGLAYACRVVLNLNEFVFVD